MTFYVYRTTITNKGLFESAPAPPSLTGIRGQNPLPNSAQWLFVKLFPIVNKSFKIIELIIPF